MLALRPAALGRRCRKRLAAVRAFAALPEAAALAAANKRVGNILKKSRGRRAGDVDAGAAAASRPKRPCTRRWQVVAPQADAAFDAGDYTASLQTLAALRAPVDAFFDDVMVNADDAGAARQPPGLLARCTPR